MQEESIGNMKKIPNKLNKGMSTLEILLAFAILILTITAVIGMGFGNQSITVDAETNTEALFKAQELLENARANSRKDFFSVITSTSTDSIYEIGLTIEDLTPCKKQATSTVIWNTDGGRTQTIELGTFLTDVAGTLALGGDCAINIPDSNWDNPTRFAKDSYNPGKPIAIDVLNKIAYMSVDTIPYLYVADTSSAILNQNGGLVVNFANNFNQNGKVIDEINDIDVIKNLSDNKVYAFIAMASTTAQLAVIEVTDFKNPVLKAKRALLNVNQNPPNPVTSHGYRLTYFDKKIYIVTRETSGPELHIFNVENPENPLEIGSGLKLVACKSPQGTTANDLIVNNNYLYLAVEKKDCELIVYDLTSGFPVYLNNASVDLPGDQNGSSLAILGKKLFFGREIVNSGPELYFFDISNPLTAVGGLPSFDSPKEIGGGIYDLYAINKFLFIATQKSNEEFQVWNIKKTPTLPIIKWNFGNVLSAGFDYEPDFMYVTGQSTPNFQILYSPPK